MGSQRVRHNWATELNLKKGAGAVIRKALYPSGSGQEIETHSNLKDLLTIEVGWTKGSVKCKNSSHHPLQLR